MKKIPLKLNKRFIKVKFNWKSQFLLTFLIEFDCFQYMFNPFWSISNFLIKSKSNLIDFVMTNKNPASNLDKKKLIESWFDLVLSWDFSLGRFNRLRLQFCISYFAAIALSVFGLFLFLSVPHRISQVKITRVTSKSDVKKRISKI